MSSYHRKSHCVDKTILWLSYLHNGISFTGKTTSLYWIGALNILGEPDQHHGSWCPGSRSSAEHPWVWLCRINRTLSSKRVDFIYLCHLRDVKRLRLQIWFYVFWNKFSTAKVNTLRLWQHFPDTVSKCIFLNKNYEFRLNCHWIMFLRSHLTIYSSIGSDNGLAPTRWQAFIRSNDG